MSPNVCVRIPAFRTAAGFAERIHGFSKDSCIEINVYVTEFSLIARPD
jgi:hypothetical protein